MGATKPSPSIPKPRLVSKQELFIFSPCSGSAAPWRHKGHPGAQGWVHESNAPHGWNYVGWGFTPLWKQDRWPSVGMSESKYLRKLICLSHQTILNLEYLPPQKIPVHPWHNDLLQVQAYAGSFCSKVLAKSTWDLPLKTNDSQRELPIITG